MNNKNNWKTVDWMESEEKKKRPKRADTTH